MSEVGLDAGGEVDEALRVLAQVQPPDGMNDRVLQRLRDAEREGTRGARWCVSRWLVLPALSALVGVFVVMGLRSWEARPSESLRVQHGAQTPQVADRTTEVADAARRTSTVSQGLGVGREDAVSIRRNGNRTLTNGAGLIARDGNAVIADSWDERAESVAVAAEPVVSRGDRGVPGHALPAFEHAVAPGQPLPKFEGGSVPGQALPAFEVAEVPGRPLPTFAEAMKTGDQP